MFEPAREAGDQRRDVDTAAVPGRSVIAGLNTITVVGRATVHSAPDEAVVTLTVEADGTEPGLAMNADSVATTRMLGRLKTEGVREEAIETTNVTVFPVRTYDPQTGQETLVGYRAQNTVTVTLKDLDMVGRVLPAAIEGGATNIAGPVWRLTEDSVAVHDALRRAVADARAKAEVLARAQDMTAGMVLMMNEGVVERAEATTEIEMRAMAGAALKARVDSVPVSTGTLRVTAAVTVTYELSR